MDQIKIGKFISNERKSKNLTQKQLADMLLISDKAISKWETGRGFPDISLLVPLCEILDISVNELLSGERINEINYKEKAEENMVKLVNERQENKKKLLLSIMATVLTLMGAIPMICLAGLLNVDIHVRIIMVAIGILVLILGIIVACIIDREAGAYECRNCKARFVPSMRAYVMGAHTLTTRRLKCPVCEKKSFCKRVMTINK